MEETGRPIVVVGCGGLAWGRLRASAFGKVLETGLLGAGVAVKAKGEVVYGATGRTSTLPLACLDQAAVQHPTEPGLALDFELSNEDSSVTAQMPEWAEIIAGQANWATMELGRPGVLVIPPNWKHSKGSGPFLRAWGALGWRFADLDAALRTQVGNGRILGTDGLRVRILEPNQQVLTGNGAMAERALYYADGIAEKLVRSLGDELASSWLQEQNERVGWYLRQRLAWRIHEALRQREPEVTLGGEEPLVCFADAAAAGRYARLGGIRVRVRLPRIAGAEWWRKISRPGYLSRSSSGERLPGFDWRDRDNILLVGPDSSPLDFFLQLEGLRPRRIQPARLEGVDAVAVELSAWMAPTDPLEATISSLVSEEGLRKSSGEPPGEDVDPPRDGEPDGAQVRQATGTSRVAREIGERLRRLGRSSDERTRRRKSKKDKGKPTVSEKDPDTGESLDVSQVQPRAGVAVAAPAGDSQPAVPPGQSPPSVSADSAPGAADPEVPPPEGSDKNEAPPFADFEPERLELDLTDTPHTPDHLQVTVDGVPLPAEAIAGRSSPGSRQALQYELSSAELRHGSIVRIDLDAQRGGRE